MKNYNKMKFMREQNKKLNIINAQYIKHKNILNLKNRLKNLSPQILEEKETNESHQTLEEENNNLIPTLEGEKNESIHRFTIIKKGTILKN